MGLGDQDALTPKMVLCQCTGRMVASARTHPKLNQVLCVKRKHFSSEMDAQVFQCTFQRGLSDHCLFSDFQIDLHNISTPCISYLQVVAIATMIAGGFEGIELSRKFYAGYHLECNKNTLTIV